MIRFNFLKQEKLHLNKEFKLIFSKGKKYYNSLFKMFVYPGNPAGILNRRIRLGLVVSRRLGNAVKRNKLKRRIREIFRLNKHRIIKSVDIIVIPQKESVNLQYDKLEKTIINLWIKAGLIE